MSDDTTEEYAHIEKIIAPWHPIGEIAALITKLLILSESESSSDPLSKRERLIAYDLQWADLRRH